MICGLSNVYGWIIVVVIVLVVAAFITEIVVLKKTRDSIPIDTYNFLLIMNVIMAIAAGAIAVILVINLISGSAEKSERASLGITSTAVVPTATVAVTNQSIPNLRKLIAVDSSGNVNVRTSLTDTFAPAGLVTDVL